MFLVGSHYLVYWVEENCVAVVRRQQVIGDGEIGETHNMNWGKKCYKARIAATGKLMFAYMYNVITLKQS